ncbi:hypothetical protein B9G98_01592 [Wickerhamiella sorbophila]|uniref:Uncharacterized protein n=1 Tax=Wickerhamiella sorbophila TaxID=45607 RepID=A0A2T0FG48_9ASCO|nr:hypothetical protein B9G98_01592 [Wickerhamiella sorbophila]PRT53972.1 hypothetical protein B9G98_01592 [Wickerhamiella sorbophila]
MLGPGARHMLTSGEHIPSAYLIDWSTVIAGEMAEPATNSVRSLATESYNNAARLFVNREVKESFQQLSPLLAKAKVLLASNQISRQTLSKMFSLYFSIIDTQYGRVKDEKFYYDSRAKLVKKLKHGELWGEVATAFGSIPSVPPGVILSLLNLTLKREGDLKKAEAFVEEYLAQLSLDGLPQAEFRLIQQVVEMFAKVLISDNQADYAKEVIANNTRLYTASERELVLSNVENYERELIAEQDRLKAEAEELRKRENERLVQALEADEARAKAEEAEGKEKPRASTPPEALIPSAPRRVTRQQQNLLEYWKDVFKQYIRRHGLINALLILLVILSAGINRQARGRIGDGTRWLWAAVKQSAAMVFTVTYL